MSESIGTSGSIGIPDEFPADAWYLASGSTLLPEIVQAVDPASTDTIVMDPLPGFIDGNTMVYDANAGTFSVMAPGVAVGMRGDISGERAAPVAVT